MNSAAIDIGFTDLSKLDQPTEHERRPGRKGHPDWHYAEFAYYYVQALRDPNTAHKPVASVADLRSESRQYVADTIAEARKRGLLTDAPKPAQAGGELTRKALRILQELRTR